MLQHSWANYRTHKLVIRTLQTSFTYIDIVCFELGVLQGFEFRVWGSGFDKVPEGFDGAYELKEFHISLIPLYASLQYCS